MLHDGMVSSLSDALGQLHVIQDRLAVGAEEMRAAVRRIEELETRLKEAEAAEAFVRQQFLDFVDEQRERVRQESEVVSQSLHNVQTGGVWRFKTFLNRLIGRRTS